MGVQIWDRLQGQFKPAEIDRPEFELGKESRSWIERLLLASGISKVRGGAQENIFSLTFSAFATATTAKTIFEIPIPAAAAGADAIAVVQWWCEFNASAAGAGMLVELLRVTATTGITGTTQTGVKIDDEKDSGSTISASKVNATAEGTITVTEVIEVHYIPPTGGIYVQYPLAREPSAAPGTNRYWRMRLTGSSGVTPSAAAGIWWRE